MNSGETWIIESKGRENEEERRMEGELRRTAVSRYSYSTVTGSLSGPVRPRDSTEHLVSVSV